MNVADQLRDRLGARYTIERELGRGGMGMVFLARDLRLDRPVALKVMPSELVDTPALRERFLRETRTAASFSHPNIVPVYAVEEADDLLAYAMAYVEGESLAARVQRTGALTVRETVKLLRDTSYALAYAHGRGVVHRDIKPDNIMIERATGRAMVMDFGIARVMASPNATGAEGLTRVGEVVGTPEYMSPEQATGDHVDGRSDLYALGLTAHFALTGHPAVTGDTPGRVLAKQITELLPPIQSVRADTPSALAVVIDRCVKKEASDRYQTAEEVVEALDAAQLAQREIPFALRMFTYELESLSTILFFGGLFCLFLIRAVSLGDGNEEPAIAALVLATALLTRAMQAVGEIRRLAVSGFSADDAIRGLRATVAERDERRRELRANPAQRSARRLVLLSGIGLALAGVYAFRLGLTYRHPRPQGGYQIDAVGSILVLFALIAVGVSGGLLLRSPLRMSIGEAFFRITWLGPIGRLFIRVAGGRAWKRGAHVSVTPTGGRVPSPRPATAASTIAAPAVSDPRIAALESRLMELERWRKESAP